MGLSSDLISQFVKATKDDAAPKKETTVYGTVVKDQNGEMKVRLDGSDIDTPVSSTVDLNDGDRVVVMIKNHTATVTGNASDPSAGNKQVGVVRDTIADEATFKSLVANKASIVSLIADEATIEKLKADKATITDLVTEDIKAKTAEVEKLIADEATIEQLKADKATIKDLVAEDIDAKTAEVEKLIADEATIEKLTAKNATVMSLVADEADIDQLTANKATIAKIVAGKIDTESADIKYAQIDFSNIDTAWMGQFFSKSGIIKDVITENSTVTGELVGVTIKGDLVEAGTLKADRLVVKGSDGLYYKLNVDAGATTSAEVAEADLQNGLHGKAIIAKTITAEKISVSDLVAFGADIGGFHISNDAIYSGVKASLDNTTNGLFMDRYGQMALGDSNRYLKFQKASENLIVPSEISTNVNGLSLSRGSDGTSVILNGTIDENTYIVTGSVAFGDGDYTISGGSEKCGVCVFGSTYTNTGGSTLLFDADKNLNLPVGILAFSGVTYDNYVIEPMINAGTEALPYEPYGRPSRLEISADMVSFGGTPVDEYVEAEINKGRNLLLNTKAFEGPNLRPGQTYGSILSADEQYNGLTVRRGDMVVNLFNPQWLLDIPNITVTDDGFYSGEAWRFHSKYGPGTDGIPLTGFKPNTQYTILFEGCNANNEADDLSFVIEYADGSRDWTSGTRKTNAQHSYVTWSGATVSRMYISYQHGDMVYIRNVLVAEGIVSTYRPYDPYKIGSSYMDIACFGGIYPEKLGAEYTVSFYARGTGTIEPHFYGASNYLKVAQALSSNGGITYASDGYMPVPLTSDWVRHWVTWKLADWRNLFDPQWLLDADSGVSITDDGFYYGSMGWFYTKYSREANGLPITDFKPNTQYTIMFEGYNENNDANGLVVYASYTDGTQDETGFTQKDNRQYRLVTAAGKTVNMIHLSYMYGDMVYIRNVLVAEGVLDEFEPYPGDPSVEKYVLFRVSSGNSADVCGVKLEHGTVATDWSEAPEDIERERADLKTATEQLADNLDTVRSESAQSAAALQSEVTGVKQYFQYDKNVGVTIRGHAEASRNLFDKSRVDPTTATETATGFEFTNTQEQGAPVSIGLLKDLCPSVSAGDVLTMSCSYVNSYHYGLMLLRGTTRDWRPGESITIEEADLSSFLYVYGDLNVACQYNDVMIVKGAEALPYERYSKPTNQYLLLDNDEIKIMNGEDEVQRFDAYGNAVIPSLKVETQLDLLGLIFTKSPDGTINCTYKGGNA